MKLSTENKREQAHPKPLTSSQRIMHHILQPSHWAKRETHTGQKGRR